MPSGTSFLQSTHPIPKINFVIDTCVISMAETNKQPRYKTYNREYADQSLRLHTLDSKSPRYKLLSGLNGRTC